MFKNRAQLLFLILGAFFLTNALVAQFIGAKIFSLEQTLGFEALNLTLFSVEDLGFNLTAGVLLWPVVFVMTDIINEYYGVKGVKLLTYLAIGLIIYAFAMVFFAINLSPNNWWDSISGLRDEPSDSILSMNLAFRRIFGQGLWIIMGSLIAFFVGQVLDVSIFHKIRQWTGEEKIWLRATGSTIVSQLVDSFVVLMIAFYIGADWDLVRVLAIGCVNFCYKVFMAVLLTPIIYLAHNFIDKFLGRETAEHLKNEAAI